MCFPDVNTVASSTSTIMATVVHRYSVPRSQIDVEAIAQEWVRYLKITAEDAEILARDPAARDAIIAELSSNNPAVKPSFWPSDTVGVNLPLEKYDEYLAHANEAIAHYTPPRSMQW